MIKEKIDELNFKIKECNEIKEEIQRIIVELALKWADIFNFGKRIFSNDFEEYNIEISEMEPCFIVKFEYYAGNGEYDYWEQKIGAFQGFKKYPSLPNDKLILTYDEIDNSEETIAGWKKRKSDWFEYHKNKLRKEQKNKKECERKLYKMLKNKYEK